MGRWAGEREFGFRGGDTTRPGLAGGLRLSRVWRSDGRTPSCRRPLAAAANSRGSCRKKREAGVRIHGNAVLPTNEAGDARVRQSGVVGEAVLGNAHRLQKIFEEDFAGMNIGDELGLFHGFSGSR